MKTSSEKLVRPGPSNFLNYARPVLTAHRLVFQQMMNFSWTALRPQWPKGACPLEEVTIIEQLTLRPPQQAAAVCAFSFSWEIFNYLAYQLWGERPSYKVAAVEAWAKELGQMALATAFPTTLPPLLGVFGKLGIPQDYPFPAGAIMVPCLSAHGPLKIFWSYQEFKTKTISKAALACA